MLLGRSQADEAIKARVSALKAKGGDALYLTADIADQAGLGAAIAAARSRFGRIDGVFHSAMASGDAAFESMGEADFLSVLKAKVRGSVNLAAAWDEPPDFLALFSSLVGVTGNAGQAGYAAGCSFQDAFALSGRAGFPVVSIDWGFWGIGSSGSERLHAHFAAMGIRPLSLEPAMDAMLGILAQARPQAAIVAADAAVLRALQEPASGSAAAAPASPAAKAARPAGPTEPPADAAGNAGLIEAALVASLAEVLKVPAEEIEPQVPYTDLGFDLLLAVRAVAGINQSLGIALRSNISNFPTVRALAAHAPAAFPGVIAATRPPARADAAGGRPEPAGKAAVRTGKPLPRHRGSRRPGTSPSSAWPAGFRTHPISAPSGKT